MSESKPDTISIPSPVLARVWHEGSRVAERNVISVECDGDEVELLTTDDETVTFSEDEWDELTVQYT